MGIVRDINFNLLVMNGFKSISEGISTMCKSINVVWNAFTGKNSLFSIWLVGIKT